MSKGVINLLSDRLCSLMNKSENSKTVVKSSDVKQTKQNTDIKKDCQLKSSKCPLPQRYRQMPNCTAAIFPASVAH